MSERRKKGKIALTSFPRKTPELKIYVRLLLLISLWNSLIDRKYFETIFANCFFKTFANQTMKRIELNRISLNFYAFSKFLIESNPRQFQKESSTSISSQQVDECHRSNHSVCFPFSSLKVIVVALLRTLRTKIEIIIKRNGRGAFTHRRRSVT